MNLQRTTIINIEYEQSLFKSFYSTNIEEIYDSMSKQNDNNRYRLDYWHYSSSNVELFFINKSILKSGVLINIDPEKNINDYLNVPPLNIPECIVDIIYSYMREDTTVDSNKRKSTDLDQVSLPPSKKRNATQNIYGIENAAIFQYQLHDHFDETYFKDYDFRVCIIKHFI